jgi:hypothetical protein
MSIDVPIGKLKVESVGIVTVVAEELLTSTKSSLSIPERV